MFWNFMNKVHGLPTYDRKDVDPWWTDEERAILDFVEGQLSYNDNGSVVRLVDEKGLTVNDEDYFKWMCIGPEIQECNEKLVFGLPEEWASFISKHVDIGKYVGAVTQDMVDIPFMCYKCGETVPEEQQEEFSELLESVWMFDSCGFGRRFEGTVQQKIENKCECPECGNICEVAWYEEIDIDTIWVFEKGSIIFSHYGRGAGMSFKFHRSLKMDGKDPMVYFSELLQG